MRVGARTIVAGVVGRPVRHSLSPLLHNAWLEASGLDGVYVAFAPPEGGFSPLMQGLRGGTIRGLNITLPFKEQALSLAQPRVDQVSDRARLAGAANLAVFADDASISFDNTDGEGLFSAFANQAPSLDLTTGPVVILGAGGAARGAAAAMVLAGVPQVRIINRTRERADKIAQALGPAIVVYAQDQSQKAWGDAIAVVNATSLGLGGGSGPAIDWQDVPQSAVFMDMVYKPLETEFLKQARERGHVGVDGLDMLIGQAAPSFEAFFGSSPPPIINVRALALSALAAEAQSKS